MNLLERVPKSIRVVEVGPRDGLQNEKAIIAAEDKIKFVEMLADAGLSTVEVTSFVSPKWVPQLADAAEVFAQVKQKAGVRYPVLVPNEKGLERAIEAGAKQIAFFTAASETFNQKNTNVSITQSLENFAALMPLVRQNNLWVRAYVSMVFHCPYEGAIASQKVIQIARSLFEMGIDEVSLGDTIGAAVPSEVAKLTDELLNMYDPLRLAYHFHDTRGTALANVLMALQYGIRIFDSSAGGLGGCPYAPGASGNLATEDLLYLLNGMSIETGVEIEKVAAASQFIQTRLGKPLASKYLQTCQAPI